MSIETKRLILRPWREEDVEVLYKYAKDPDVGPAAGWQVHRDIEYSLQIIRSILMKPETYALELKETGEPIGSISLMFSDDSDLVNEDDECELGYWLGKPYWGRGLVPEAAQAILRHAFDELGMERVWCGYYDGNIKSKRVQEKLGFRYQWTTEQVDVPQMHEFRKGHVNLLTRKDWLG